MQRQLLGASVCRNKIKIKTNPHSKDQNLNSFQANGLTARLKLTSPLSAFLGPLLGSQTSKMVLKNHFMVYGGMEGGEPGVTC